MCVVGAGIAGLSAAIESARLHRDVALVDARPRFMIAKPFTPDKGVKPFVIMEKGSAR